MKKFTFYFFIFFSLPIFLGAKLPEIDSNKTKKKIDEILTCHACHKEVNSKIIVRAFQNFLEETDPNRMYFCKEDICEWLEPVDTLLSSTVSDYHQSNFQNFEKIYEKMAKAIERRKKWEKEFIPLSFSEEPKLEDFQKIEWTKNEEELKERIIKIKRLQHHAISKLSEELKFTSLQRLDKMQAKFEEGWGDIPENEKNRLFLSKVIKAFASSLDSHTVYFTPAEASQFLINVQQRLFGIGAQLRDDIDGFTVVKLVEGGPAFENKSLKVKDKIIAVNREPVLGMDIKDAVDLIRGEEHSLVKLTVIRQEDGKEKKLEVMIPRGEVVLKETRYTTTHYPYGDGIIAHLHLHSFYQDPTSSSAADLTRALRQLKKDNKVHGVILDLRYNSGGMLTQAVAVTGMFMKKGIVVSIKDDKGHVQHLRDLDSRTAFDGPLVVLINRGSASASEIVAQTLQDYGRALVIGDSHSFGKGSFQTFSLQGSNGKHVNPEGEYKVTKGRYYTVSGKTPQLEGVVSDICIPGILSEMEVGEKYAKYPLEGDKIKENFEDDLSDIPYLQRDRVKTLYKFDLQPKLFCYTKHIDQLKNNSKDRIKEQKNYDNFLKEIRKKKEDKTIKLAKFGRNDLQLQESLNVLKDLILIDFENQ